MVQRDPASPAFIDLGEAYLALGRPRDAIGVGGLGLEAAPDSLEGRVMLARAHASLHQWKEAQAELLRVVKIDRSNRRGFALLGEVLMRRNDFERAVPVLQHAQNLDPTSPQILALLKRARAGQQLDPPPPLPQPVPPRGETDNDASIVRSRGGARASEPTIPAKSKSAAMAVAAAPKVTPKPQPVAAATKSAPMAAQAPKPTPPSKPPAPPPKPAPPPPPAPAIHSDLEVRGDPTMPSAPPMGERGDTWAGDPTTAGPSPLDDEPVPPARAPKKSPPPRPIAYPPAPSGATPNENFLNDLLTAGGVGPSPEGAAYDLRPDKRWGRSLRATFIFLFVVLVLGIGGGGGYYWWSEKKKNEAVRALQAEAKQAIKLGDYAGIHLSIDKLAEALDKDKSNLLTLAYAAEAAGIDALLYGVSPAAADQALSKLGKEINKGEPGYREIVVGRAAVELSRLGVVTSGRPAKEVQLAANTTLAETSKMLDDYLDKNDDKWVRWLKARAQLAAGERKAARATLKQAADGEDGLVVAMIDQADLLADDGALEDALALYDRVLAKAKQHPLAVLGKALARAEAGLDTTTVIDDINLAIGDSAAARKMGTRVTAYRALALGLAELGIEDYAKANADLRTAVGGKPLADDHLCAQATVEPRFWAGVAWGAYMRGDLLGTANARNCVIWYGKDKAEDDPSVQVVDAGLALAEGHPDKALDIANRLEGARARAVRVYANLDLRKTKDALAEADKLVAMTTPKDGDAKQASIEARILDGEAKLINAATDKEREPIANDLDKLASQAQSKLGRHALGMGWAIVGNQKEAQTALEAALRDLSEANPNPLAYRTKTMLADILIGVANAEQAKQPDDAKDKLAEAHKLLDEALKLDSGYDPALATMAKLLVREGDLDKAMSVLDPILKEPDVPVGAQLTYAEILVSHKDPTDADKEQATKILRDIKDKVDPKTEVGRVANLIDLKLPEELGVPVPPDAPGPPGSPKTPTPPHHHH